MKAPPKRERTPEMATAQRAAYQKNREKVRAKSKERYERERKSILAKNAARRAARSPETVQKDKEAVRRWHKENPERVRELAWKKAGINITWDEYVSLLNAQDGKCAICRTTDWRGHQKVPRVDHCHITGRVRGLLCNSCNIGLGHFSDSVELLEAALRYLKRTAPEGAAKDEAQG